MNRSVLIIALAALTASSDRCLAQTPSLPVIQPKVTELVEFRDTALYLTLAPQEVALSPRRTLMASKGYGDGLRIWNLRSHANHFVLAGWAENIAWSPAGDAIAFTRGGEGSGEHVWMVRLNPATGEAIGSPQRVSLTATNDVTPQFSPDGRSIAFSRQDPGEHSSLAVVPAAGGPERVLASGYGIRNLRWAVDGSAIYYASYHDSAMTKAMLRRVAVNGGATQLVHNFAGESRSPALSVDNRVVRLSWDTGAEQAVRIGDLNGRALATLSVPVGGELGCSGRWGEWSGEYRVAGVRWTIPRGLHIVSVADGKNRELIDSTGDVQAVAWFDDNRRIAAIVFHDGKGELVTMNADGGGTRKLPLAVQPFWNPTVGHGFALSLRVSPDGRYAVYQGPGRRSLELVNLSTGEQRTLTRAQTINTPVWHRDSRTIRFMQVGDVALTDPDRVTVHDVSLDGVDKLVRAFPRSQYPNAVWLAGENYVSIFGGNTFSVARFDGTSDQVLLRESTTRSPGVISRDGHTVAVSPGVTGSNTPSHRVVLLSLSDGSQRSINLPFSEIDCTNFSPDGRYLYCRGREAESGPQTTYEVPLDGTKPRVVTRIDTREFMGASEMSPDGQWLLQTVAGVRHGAFVALDFTEGMTRLLSSPTQP